MVSVIKNRISLIAKRLKNDSLDGIILTSFSNVTYATNFSGHDSWALILGKNVYLITDSRYAEQAKIECPSCKVIQRKDSLAEEANKIIEKRKNKLTLGFENKVSVAVHDQMKKYIKAKLKKTVHIAEEIRSVKSDQEVAMITKASKIAESALESTLKQVYIGITESAFAGLLDFEMRKRGACAAFDTILAFGANASMCHYMPGSCKLKKNDTILVDFGANYKGYLSDKTRCLAVGKPSAEYLRAYDVLAKAQAAAIATIKDGTPYGDVDAAARDMIENAGFPAFQHGTGHGVGLDIHELPFMGKGRKETLVAGQVITVEPGIYVAGKFGVRLEDDVLVTKTGCKILSRTKKSPELTMLEL
jgi:Xaa-Pro aminopeptidase